MATKTDDYIFTRDFLDNNRYPLPPHANPTE